MNLKVIEDKVIILPDKENEPTKLEGGLQLLENQEDNYVRGTVVVANPKFHIPSVGEISSPVEEGDRVAFNNYAPSEFYHEGEKYFIIKAFDIAVVYPKVK